VDAPEEGCDPVGSPYWRRLLTGPMTPWREEPTLEDVLAGLVTPQGTHD